MAVPHPSEKANGSQQNVVIKKLMKSLALPPYFLVSMGYCVVWKGKHVNWKVCNNSIYCRKWWVQFPGGLQTPSNIPVQKTLQFFLPSTRRLAVFSQQDFLKLKEQWKKELSPLSRTLVNTVIFSYKILFLLQSVWIVKEIPELKIGDWTCRNL